MGTRLFKPNPFGSMPRRQTNIEKIISATLAGLAGGASLLSFFGLTGLILGAIIGGLIVGASELPAKRNNPKQPSSSVSVHYSDSKKHSQGV